MYILTILQFPSALSKTLTVAPCVIITIKVCFLQNLFLCFLLHEEFHAPLLYSLMINFKINVWIRGILRRNGVYYQHWIRRLVSKDLFLPYAFLNKDSYFFCLHIGTYIFINLQQRYKFSWLSIWDFTKLECRNVGLAQWHYVCWNFRKLNPRRYWGV